MISGKFAITTHILTLLAKFPEEYLASDYIAGSLNIHPVLVRKEIANLKKNHLVESREGKYGGTKLLKSPEAISMEEIFNITFEKVNFGFSKNDPNPLCPVGKQINTNRTHLYDDINDSIISKLKTISLAELSEKF